MIKAIATASFVHGSQSLKRGEEADFTLSTFTALAANGLVREKPAEQAESAPARVQRAARAPSNKKAPEVLNKAAPDAPISAAEVITVQDLGAAPTGAAAEQVTDEAAAGTADADQS